MTEPQLDILAPASKRAVIGTTTLDALLTVQLAVAWAGEGGEEPRLGWWRSDLASEYGGEDLFQQLLPSTWRWAVLQGVREAARRHDARLRREDHAPDSLYSLFNLGFDLDERLDERLAHHKRAGTAPGEALPGLVAVFASGLREDWDADAFATWAAPGGAPTAKTTPTGRQLSGAPPADPVEAARQLVAALVPLGDAYPLPHYRKKEGA